MMSIPARFLPSLALLGALVAVVAITATPRPAETAFPGTNGRIVYGVFNGTNDDDIWSINPDGSDPLQLTSGDALDADSSASPSGMKIAFDSDRDTGLNYELYTMDIDGNNVQRIANDSFNYEYPAWSPDGTKILFNDERDEANNQEIYVIPAAGGAVTRLTNLAGYDQNAAWSPDGTHIAFNHLGEIYTMLSNGSNPVSTNHMGESPDWSPDSSHIVYSTITHEIHTMTTTGANDTHLSQIASGQDPVWSPDGTKIAYWVPGIAGSVWVADANGANAHQISPAGQDAFEPSWAVLPAAPTPSASPTAAVTASPAATPTQAPTTTANGRPHAHLRLPRTDLGRPPLRRLPRHRRRYRRPRLHRWHPRAGHAPCRLPANRRRLQRSAPGRLSARVGRPRLRRQRRRRRHALAPPVPA